MASSTDAPTLVITLHQIQPGQPDRQGNRVPPSVAACELSWEVVPEPVDEGLDPRVIDALSDTFCAYGKMAFTSDREEDGGSVMDRIRHQWLPAGQPIQKNNYTCRRLHIPRIRSKALFLIETFQPEIARNFFLIQAWHYASCQIAFFRETFGDSIALSDTEIQAVILDGGWVALTHALQASSSLAVCTLGHDGAWVKFVFPDEKAMRLFDATLKARCAVHGLPCASDI